MARRHGVVLILVAGLVLYPALGPGALAFEINATGTCYRVVDGDTIDVSGLGRVRLSDIDAPERGRPGAKEASDYTASLVLSKTVYLDIDNVDVKDRYGRWIAVVYVRHNATHILNVNKALLDGGYAVIWDFKNEFNPYTWTLYVQYPSSTPTKPPAPTPSPTPPAPGPPSPSPPSTGMPSGGSRPTPGGSDPSPLIAVLVGIFAVIAVAILVAWSLSRNRRP